MTTAYIGLGSNLGDREGYVNSALKLLADNENIKLVRTSGIIETPPLGQMNQPKYLNSVAEVKTNLTAEDLHKKLIEIETSLGRVRKKGPRLAGIQKWAPRTIDLDLLLFGEHVINHSGLSDESNLTVPHPQMHLRSFVLKGLCQINHNLIHPVIKEPVNVLADRLNGQDFVLNPNMPQLVSVAGIIGVGKTTLAKNLSKLLASHTSGGLGCKLILEPYDKNPFLPDVYAGKKDLALDSQLFFLTSRIEQLNHNVLAKGQLSIADYVFNKELIYAKRLLNPQQLTIYKKIYPPFAEKVVQPVLVIYLTDSIQNCLGRIHKRNRPYEQKIQLQFLEALYSDHDQLFSDWKICPLIRLSMSEFDCTNPEDLKHLANQMKFYVTAKSKPDILSC